MGYAVAQLGETLRYKPEGRWFDWGLWDFSLT
jgi:cytochrome c-type biogenesis protein CcmH/NrfF